MIDGIPVIDVHVHAARVPSLKPPPEAWKPGFASEIPFDELHDDEGRILPDRFDAYLEAEGIDVALLMAEYSPKVTGLQTVEDMLPIVEHDPERFRFIGAINPHYHFPLVEELERQLDLGAVALKIHPVHGGYPPNVAELFPVYHVCEERGIPVVFHCGTSTFPGAANRYGDPVFLDDVAGRFPDLTMLLAHGGRGWWYDAAAFLSQAHANVWIELSGLPPQRLSEYYQRFDLDRLATKMVWGSDWPAVPSERGNVEQVRKLGLADDVLEGVLWRNAARLYRLDDVAKVSAWLADGTR
ncbi:MAG: amidohydrolase family protein [Nitriliruptorales bacterium]